MSSWETLDEKEIKVGETGFLAIARKKPPTGDKEVVTISKGWYTEENEKRYKKGGLGFSTEVIDEVIEALKAVKA